MTSNRVIRFLKKLKPYNIQKGLRYLKHFGLKEFLVRLSERMEPEEVPYGPWYEEHRAKPEELERQRKQSLAWENFSGGEESACVFSIAVPVFRTPAKFLCEMIESVRSQSFPFWELCLANADPEDREVAEILERYCREDRRIRVKNLKENKGISENTNAALAMARGEFVGLLDHDDLLAPDALYEMAARLEKDGGIDVFYTDEDKVTTDLSEHFQPHLKPDFNLDLLRSNNYICHFFVVRREIAERIGGFRPEFNGAQDYDFIFRCTEEAEKIVHIPRILYHWRVHSASTADNPASKMYAYEAGKRAIEGNLERSGVRGVVSLRQDYGFYDVHYPVEGEPLVSILIPNKDQKETLMHCIHSVLETSTWKNLEILIIENNSEQEETFACYRELEKDPRIRILTYPGKTFNYSAINNFGVQQAKGEYLLFLNNDIEVITPDWIEQMLGNCQRPEVGIVGAKLYYPDNTIQHAGIIIGIGGIAGHAFLGLARAKSGYLHKASLQMDYSAVTAACMMMKAEAFRKAGGFEEKLTVAFNDVDLCLRTVEQGWLVVYDPHVEMYHYESKSRGAEDSEEKLRRFQQEIEFMRTRWIRLLKDGDPNYNPNLTLSKWNYSLRGRKK
ncbi:MAG: glycosyltransferase family 2 protein [Lacrimispora saccharolytica]